MKLLVATRNSKKLVELDRILRAAGIDSVELLSLSDVPELSLIHISEPTRHTNASRMPSSA